MATEDILINDGDSFVSLSALAAEQVEAELPIEDAGKTVKIWSAASNFINFDTAGTSDFKMDPSSNFTANGKFISKATGITEVSFSSTNGQDGFAIVSAGYPGIVSGNQQIQNWNYTADVDSYKRYQATVKARGGDDSYSEMMFLSDASSNQGLRFLACGKDVTGVRGWPLGLDGIGTATPDSGGASALIHVGYAIEGTSPTEYTPLVVGTSTRSDFILMAYGTKALTLDPMKNDAVFVYSVRSDSFQGTADSDASIDLGANLTISTGGKERVLVDGSGHVVVNRQDSASTLPRTNTMLEVVSDSDSPFCLILDGKEAAGVYEGRTGVRQYGTGGSSSIFEYAIDSTNGTYMFSGGTSGRSAITKGESVADILVKPGEYVRLTPEVRTDKITSKSGDSNNASIELGAELLTTNHTPTQPNSIATKQTVDDKIWVGTTAQYNAISPKNPTTLYCITD
ncbi:MAG: phage upper tail fiber protein [Pirellulales bacterium]